MSINPDNSTASAPDISQTQVEPILPRSAWNSQLAYLKVMFKAKKALDRIEQETGNGKNIKHIASN
ncbi:hypothetical protein [Anabaena sp. UHCC 0399]|uniref:hypothetical protein n=1 Tax=Anabaena sp. UHCC 0399 TaxID=3110238 RepID=UPI002B204561|nr:hypothetical protein [Anabaena sp. UHCC 0399]MEA5565621.1 hypothetical protein [Anabaena sp. UHCC 0399]